MNEILKWAVFIIYSGMYWITLAAGLVMTAIVVAAVWSTIRRR